MISKTINKMKRYEMQLRVRSIRKIIIPLLLLAATTSHAQFIITDKDGYTNIRKQPNAKSEITGKVLKNQIFFHTDIICGFDTEINPESDWLQITTDGTNIAGYIYKGNIVPLEKFSTLGDGDGNGGYRGVFFIDNGKITCTNDTMQVILFTKPFDLKAHKTDARKDDYVDYYTCTKIDGKYFLGTDGMLPGSEIKALEITHKGKKIIVPTNKLKHCYNLNAMWVYIGTKNELYVGIGGGDGAGGYNVWFSIIGGKIMYVIETGC